MLLRLAGRDTRLFVAVAGTESSMNRGLQLVQEALLDVGHRRDRLVPGVSGPGLAALREGFVAYADRPLDARTSTFVAVDMDDVDEARLSALQPTGAPIIAQCAPTHVLLWKQGTDKPRFITRVETLNVLSFFQKFRDELNPGSIYRAKLWGRTNHAWQLDMFVDGGLLPLVEETAGESLRKLLEGAVKDAKSAIGGKNALGDEDGAWLLKAVFWLLAAKILRDKGVRGFSRLSLVDVEQVYLTLAKHYNRKDPRPLGIASARKRQALVAVAPKFEQAANMSAVTTESLAWVYESALIDKLTRQKLGTHSTPTWLIDDIVGKLRPWIEELPVDARYVFEPACGHAGFLISAMRLLSELLPAEQTEDRKDYLRKRIRGIEIDAFACEVGRLALTLADVPNGNGWQLELGDMFQGNALRSAIASSTIVLANPPFEKFGSSRPDGVEYFNRADETIRHIVEGLPLGGVFGVVVPQTFLRSPQTQRLQRLLLDEYDLTNITLFADKVFNYGDSETAALIGRRVGAGPKRKILDFGRVRESQIDTYKNTLVPSSSESVARDRLVALNSLFVPELDDVWQWLRMEGCGPLGAHIDGGQGFQHKGANDPALSKGVIRESSTERRGLVQGFASWNEEQTTHELPTTTWLNLDRKTIGRPRHGTVVGHAQILVNYACISREPWRLKAIIDEKGHPATSDFNVVRPKYAGLSLEVLWAILNSPVANAYAYAHSSKRHVLVGDIREMPVFPLEQGTLEPLQAVVRAYFDAARGVRGVPRKRSARLPIRRSRGQTSFEMIGADHDNPNGDNELLKYLHWRIDAEILRLYGLPAWAERKILDLFTGVWRRGVPFYQDCYFPKGFTSLDRLSDLMAITVDWAVTNERRCELIRKDVRKRISSAESEELRNLELLADARSALMDVLYPEPPDVLEAVIERLKREGKWTE